MALSVIAAALSYVQRYSWQDRIYVQDRWRSSEAYNPSDNPDLTGSINPDTGRTATVNPDPYRQGYYNHSEGLLHAPLTQLGAQKRRRVAFLRQVTAIASPAAEVDRACPGVP